MATLAHRSVSLAAAVTLLGLSISCNKNPTVPTAVLVSEDKSGTLQVGGTDIKLFTVNYVYSNTDVALTLKTLTSVASGAALSLSVGVALGNYSTFDGSCTRAITANATVGDGGHSTNQGLFSAGQFCVSVFDTGTLTEPVNYTVTVQHY
jgi:hypothetical protein